jgi:hypothetical protein
MIAILDSTPLGAMRGKPTGEPQLPQQPAMEPEVAAAPAGEENVPVSQANTAEVMGESRVANKKKSRFLEALTKLEATDVETGGELNFNSIQENFKREPKGFQEAPQENRIFEALKRGSTAEKMQEADILAGPYKRVEIPKDGGLENWRTMVEYQEDPVESTDRLFEKLAKM